MEEIEPTPVPLELYRVTMVVRHNVEVLVHEFVEADGFDSAERRVLRRAEFEHRGATVEVRTIERGAFVPVRVAPPSV